MKQLLRAATLALLTGSATAAIAQDEAPSAGDIRKAASAFDSGREAYKSGAYAEAAEHFELADTHAASDKALEFAIRSRQKAGQLDRAATLAELALRRYPDNHSLQELCDEVLALTAGDLARVSVRCDVPCELVVGTTLVYGRAATDRVVYLEPGEHTMVASWPKQGSAKKKVVAELGGESEVHFERPGEAGEDKVTLQPLYRADDTPVEDEGVEDEEEGGGLPPEVFWAGAVLTVVGAGVTVWSGIDTLNNPGEERIETECVGLGTDCKLYKQGKLNELRTNILLGVTGGLGVATGIIGVFATDWSGGEQSEAKARGSSPSVQPWLGIGQGVSVGALGRF